LRALPRLPPAAEQTERIQTGTQEKSKTRSLRRRGFWLIGGILVLAGLIVTLRQMRVFDRRDRRPGVVLRQPTPSAGTAAPAASRGASPEAKAGVAAYKVLAVKLDPYKSDKRTLRLSIRVTVGKDSRGVVVNRNFFRLLVDGLALPPTKYTNEYLPPQTGQDFDVEFVIPKTATQVSLQVGDVKGETSEIPIDLKAALR
jgi:hypothetical protein